MAKITLPKQPWTGTREEVLGDLMVTAEKGLGAAEVRRRRTRFGRNKLREVKPKSGWRILADQFKSLMIGLLGVAAVASFILGDWLGGVAIGTVLIINGAIGFFTELKATRSMEALRHLGRVTAKVRRGGSIREIAAGEIVPGDIVIVEGGDIIPADLRLIEASKVQADESALTGESVPVGKTVEPMDGEVDLAERKNMLFKGTAVTRGSGEGVVTATGQNTELGQISSMVGEAGEEQTPLEVRLDQLSRKLMWATLGIAVLVVVSGVIRGKETFLMIETGIALAVATIPEGLPIVATVALARGMLRMARRNALVNRLSAVETLGATGVICTDKTGTLTENRMTVTRLVLDSGEIDVAGPPRREQRSSGSDGGQSGDRGEGAVREVLEVGILCNNASLGEGEDKEKIIGDPMEAALLAAGEREGIDRGMLTREHPEEREEAFDPEIKMMATFNKTEGGYLVAVKGAPEPVLNAASQVRTGEGERMLTDEDRKEWMESNLRLAEEGFRVLAVAKKTVDGVEADPYEGLTFLGLVGFVDPPREDVRQAIASCRQAGIRVVMVTGDQPATARYVARSLNLAEENGDEVILGRDLKSIHDLSGQESERILKASIFARVSPKQKLDLIEIHQKKGGAIVGMTGDGVNDAPALKKADIGIAMGKRGTQVAHEAADIVLKDDAFSTIVAAVEEGRVIFGNIRKFVVFLLPCNVSEVLAIGLASLFDAPLPILPLQILFLNLVADAFPALALGVGGGDPSIMKEPPRDPEEPVLTNRHWLAIGGYGAIFTLTILGALWIARSMLNMEEQQAVTVSFLSLAFAHLWHVFNMRSAGSRLVRNEITRNPYIWGSIAVCAVLLAAAVYTPGISGVLQVSHPGLNGWMVILAMSLVPLLVAQAVKILFSARR